MRRGTRRSSRKAALQILYQMEMSRHAPDRAIDLYWKYFSDAAADVEFSNTVVQGVHQQRAEIDALIEHQSEHWRMARMSCIDRNILRIAAYELKNLDSPTKVVINEAIEMAKHYGSEHSPAFVNGILDRLALTLRPGGS